MGDKSNQLQWKVAEKILRKLGQYDYNLICIQYAWHFEHFLGKHKYINSCSRLNVSVEDCLRWNLEKSKEEHEYCKGIFYPGTR